MDYYYVYYPYGNAPRYKHATKEAAIAEAKRLAGEQPARKFEILHCIGYVEAENLSPCSQVWKKKLSKKLMIMK